MPRPVSPLALPLPTPRPFRLTKDSVLLIAETLGHNQLDSLFISAVEHAVACYLAIRSDTDSATVMAVIVALQELKGSAKKREKVISSLANNWWRGDQQSHAVLQLLARSAQAGDAGVKSALMTAADRRLLELEFHPRVRPDVEALRHFCGILRELFNYKATKDALRTWQNCEAFARAVLAAAGIECHHLFEHTDRLRAYLRTDVSLPNRQQHSECNFIRFT